MKESFYSKTHLNEYRRDIVPKKTPCVEISHCRIDSCPKGGMTLIRLWVEKNLVITGHAFCCDKDTYNKKKGKSIAFGRLMRTAYLLGLKEQQLWQIKKFIWERIGKVNEFYFAQAYNGDEIK